MGQISFWKHQGSWIGGMCMCHNMSKNCSLGVGSKKLHSNKSTPSSFNCKICGTAEFPTSLYYSCATLQETLGLIPLVMPSSVSTDHQPQGGILKCRVSKGREEGPISSSKPSTLIHRRRKAITV